jgi:hypothetical protein
VSFFNGRKPPVGQSTSVAKDGDFWNVSVYGLPAGDFSFKLRIANGSLGKAGAIVQASHL